MRKNIGIIMMMLGVLLTISPNREQNQLLKQVEDIIKVYWPLFLSFIGIYMISTPKRKR